jgi:hypothetical protein
VFIFVNPTSGGNHASKFMRLPCPLKLTLGDAAARRASKAAQEESGKSKNEIRLHSYDIRRGAPGKKRGFQDLGRAVAVAAGQEEERM